MTDAPATATKRNFGIRTYVKRWGDFWDYYPEKVHERWKTYGHDLKEGLVQPEPVPEEWKLASLNDEWKEPTYTYRFGDDVPFPRPKLTIDEKREIVEGAKSREDFHDLDKILRTPSSSRCLCELRFIAGTDCKNHYRKGKDGKTLPEAKNHWAWFIDINPRGMLCPFAEKNGHDHEGDPSKFHCDILLPFDKTILGKWVMEQHPDDPEGTMAPRIVGDLYREGPCVQCDRKGKYRIDPKTNEIINLGDLNPLTRVLGAEEKEEIRHDIPAEWDPGDEKVLPPSWSLKLCVKPCEYRRRRNPDGSFKFSTRFKYINGSEADLHPIYKEGELYHIFQFTHRKWHAYPRDQDLWYPPAKKYLDERIEEIIEEEVKKGEKLFSPETTPSAHGWFIDQIVETRRQAARAKENEEILKDNQREALVNILVAKDIRRGKYQ